MNINSNPTAQEANTADNTNRYSISVSVEGVATYRFILSGIYFTLELLGYKRDKNGVFFKNPKTKKTVEVFGK